MSIVQKLNVAQQQPGAGVPASVLATETRQSKIGMGVLVGDRKPDPPPSLARFQAAETDSWASLKALAAEEKPALKRPADEDEELPDALPVRGATTATRGRGRERGKAKAAPAPRKKAKM
jgi:hypothetical protein